MAVVLLTCFYGSNISLAQVTVTGGQTAAQLAQMLVGPGVTMTNATLNCAPNGSGKFVVTTSNLGLDSGIVLTSGTAPTGPGGTGVNGAAALGASTATGNGGDPQLTAICGQNTLDKCILEFDFQPDGDTIKFDYVFSSEEYFGYSCSVFNDVFGFLISGPGIVGTKNLALIPGTNIPIAVNSTTNPALTNPGSLFLCQQMGAGSPFSQYFIANNTGTTITHGGFTTVFTAISEVTPCSTYHLKLAIADAVDQILDSGVFLKAGSLTSNSVSITPIGGGGLSSPVPYCVRGCLPGQFVFSRPLATPQPLVIKYDWVNPPPAQYAQWGFDYAPIPDSVVIPANATSTILQIFGLPMPTPQGPKIVKIKIRNPYQCANNMYIDSAELTIYDSFQVQILTPDTIICRNDSVQLLVQGENLLTYSWSPATGLSNPNIKEPWAKPMNTTTYTLSANLPGSGCTPTLKQVTVTIRQPPAVDIGPDRTTCIGTPFQFNPTVLPANQPYTYSWSPGTNLSSTTVLDPVFTPSTVGTVQYILTVDPGANGCNGYDTVNVRTLPGDFELGNSDTSICHGATVQVNAIGDAAFTYQWTPAVWVSNPNIINPSITPDTTTKYTITASYPTCPNIVKSFTIEVQPNPVVYIGPDREKCQWDTLMFTGTVMPAWYTQYSYLWTNHPKIDDITKPIIVFRGENDTTLVLTVTTPAGCTGSDDVNIIVHQGNFAEVSPVDSAICPNERVPIVATGGVLYHWTPATFLDDTLSATPISSPLTNIKYTGTVTDQHGCLDTVYVSIVVHPEALLDLGDSVVLYPGESYQMNPSGNCLYFSWFPPLGLSNPNIANPIAMPEVNTKYIVNGRTEGGCTATDSIVVMIREESMIDLPNAFTPGSAPNAILKINKRGLASLKYFRIFNRWGTKVYESSDIDEGWDGRFNDVPQPMGVYVYMIEAYTNTGRKVSKQGNVTLIR